MTTPGGEEAFVSDMVWEGVMLDQRCRYVLSLYGSWCLLFFEPFSQMVHPHARKAVVSHCSGYAPARSLDIPWHPKTNETTFTCGFALQITNYALPELVQGHTHRWAPAWSFTDKCLTDASSGPRTHPIPRRVLLRHRAFQRSSAALPPSLPNDTSPPPPKYASKRDLTAGSQQAPM